MAKVKQSHEHSPLVTGRIFGKNADAIDTKTIQWRLAEEIPLVIFYNGEQFGVMMLTEADLEDFAIGFSLTENIISSISDITDIRFEQLGAGLAVNIIVPETALEVARSRKRTIKGGSSCGICGAQTLEIALPKLAITNGCIPEPEIALQALNSLAEQQVLYQQNFSTHAAALVNPQGKIMLLREDVGRHNGLDKLVGAMAKEKLSGADGFLVLSSRFSVEMVQKAAMAGFSFVASISSPTALALRMAQGAAMKIAAKSDDEIMLFD